MKGKNRKHGPPWTLNEDLGIMNEKQEKPNHYHHFDARLETSDSPWKWAKACSLSGEVKELSPSSIRRSIRLRSSNSKCQTRSWPCSSKNPNHQLFRYPSFLE